MSNTNLFEQRHFVWLASHMRDRAPAMSMYANKLAARAHFERWQGECQDLATALSRTNSKFDRTKFLAACGVEE